MMNQVDKNMADFIEEIHMCIERKMSTVVENRIQSEEIEKGNWLIYEICKNKKLGPYQYANKMQAEHGYDMTGQDVIDIFQRMHLSNPEKRIEILTWAEELATYLKEALETRSHSSYDKFLAMRKKEVGAINGGRLRSQERIAAWMIFVKIDELDKYNDIKKLAMLGNTYAKYFLYDLTDVLAEYCGAQIHIKKADTMKLSIEQEKRKVAQLENMLHRTNMMLNDLQEEFEERLEESKAREMADFFTKLNSEKYGCILDELLSIRKGVNSLKRSHFELPPEISGLLIMTQQLTQFVRDNSINPIMRLNQELDVRFKDIEAYDYEGTPFLDNDEVKHVRVVAPGWIYAEKDLQIARPRLKEVIENAD